MRLAYITRTFPFGHLGETFLQPEVHELARTCERLYVIPVRPHLRTASCADAGVVNVRMPLAGAWTFVQAALEALCNPRRAGRALRAVLLPQYRFSAKVKNLLIVPKAFAVARYVRRQHVDHVHAHWLTTPGTLGYLVSILTGIPWSCTAHSHDIFADNLMSEKTSQARFIRIISCRNRDSLDRLTKGRVKSALHVIHMGVALRDDVRLLVKPVRTLRLLCPARLDPCKGHADLLAALAILRQKGFAFQCDLAGNGPLYKSLTKMVGRLSLSDCVSMRGFVPYNALLREMQRGSYDAVVLPSIEDPSVSEIYEGIPVALMEAMEAGIPCVSTKIGSIPELVDAETGILVGQHDPKALAEALMRIGDAPTRAQFAQASRRRIAREFNVVTTSRALFDLLRRHTVEERSRPLHTMRSCEETS